jgi:hypothetical protein
MKEMLEFFVMWAVVMVAAWLMLLVFAWAIYWICA